ncbi:hypothetical protein [Sphingomonas bacterium]|uniref:hypothetical protein n=1 Tax=Sphingomonas bacterium TaxID=1895847 RepID=UPI0015752763|nr:hypothetical protein [Sphingomonas bacterium]
MIAQHQAATNVGLYGRAFLVRRLLQPNYGTRWYMSNGVATNSGQHPIGTCLQQQAQRSWQYAFFGHAIDLERDGYQVNLSASDDVNLVRYCAGYRGRSAYNGPPQGPPLHIQWYWTATDCAGSHPFEPGFLAPAG